MKCIRCEKEFNDYIPRVNTESYGGPSYYTCPHCGKLYEFKRVVVVEPVGDMEYQSRREEDDWGNKVVKDKDYKNQ